MLGPLLTTAGIVAICGAAGGAMALGWRKRQLSQAHLAVVAELPNHLGTPEFHCDDVHYVGTSHTGNTLERIAVRPLAYRGRADLEVHASGVAIGITGESAFFIPVERIETVATAQSTIDRAVERDGLLALRWRLANDTSVESFFRVVDPAERQQLLEALNALVAAKPPVRAVAPTASPTSTSPSESTQTPEELA